MEKGDYVSAQCYDPQYGKVQGIYIADYYGAIELIVQGDTATYLCLKDTARVIPKEEIPESAREFFQAWHTQRQQQIKGTWEEIIQANDEK